MDCYIVITSDMIEGLDLKGNELLVFAMIHGYSQGRQGSFLGSISYISLVLNVSPRTVVNILNALIGRGLLEKAEIKVAGISRSEYSVSEEAMQKLHRSPMQKLHSPMQKLQRWGEKEKESNIKKEEKETQKEIHTPSTNVECVPTHTLGNDEKRKFAPHVELTESEYEKLEQKFGADVQWMIDRLDSYKADNPKKKYTSDYRVLIGWVAKDLLEYKIAEQRLKNAQEAGSRMHNAPSGFNALAEAKAREKELNGK